jgi:hypothetical protein
MTCAHVAFTIGTCYHVSDATSRNRADSPHGALPSLSVVRFLWCVFGEGDRRRLGQSHRLPDSLDSCGERLCVFIDRGRF